MAGKQYHASRMVYLSLVGGIDIPVRPTGKRYLLARDGVMGHTLWTVLFDAPGYQTSGGDSRFSNFLILNTTWCMRYIFS